MNEVVKYNNYMNGLKFNDFTAVDMNVLMTLCSKLRDKDTICMDFSFQELRKLTGYKQTSNEKFIKDIKRMNDKLQKVSCCVETDDEIVSFVLFPTYRISKKNCTLTVSVNTEFKFILNNLISDFTRFELEEFIKLESIYTKNLYRLLKQFRTTGIMKIKNIEVFREQMNCPAKYANKYFTDRLIKPSVEALKNIFIDLQFEPKYDDEKRGKPLVGYVFTFKPEKVPAKENVPVSGAKKGNKKAAKKKTSTNQFNQFQQNTYDFDELEKMLLSN